MMESILTKNSAVDTIFGILRKGISDRDLFLSEVKDRATSFGLQRPDRCECPLIVREKKSREVGQRLRPAGGIRD